MWIDDQIIEECHKPFACRVFYPPSTLIVLGSSNEAEKELNLELCEKHHIPILRRAGGGGAVVLHKNTLVISLGLWVKDAFSNKRYFNQINQALIQILEDYFSVKDTFNQNGISDICIGEKKCVGTSLFRSRNFLLYQASLIIDPDFALMDLYLAHPSKEPDYRRKRSHRNFLVGLNQVFSEFSAEELKDYFAAHLQSVTTQLVTDLIDPQSDQISKVLQRLVSTK